MDSLTHSVLGACLGEVIAGKKIGRKAMLIGAITNNIPDIDVVTSLWMSQADGLLAHRGFTHSILFVLLASPLLAYLSQLIFKKTDLSFKQWLLFFASGMFIHIFIDAFTTYGTGWFEPFSHERITLNTLFILDPFILLMFLFTTLALLFLRNQPEKRYKWAQRALLICCVYLGSALVIKLFVDNKVEKNITIQNIQAEKFMASPAPLSNLLWYVIIKSGSGYYTGYYSLFDKTGPMTFEYTDRRDSLISKAHTSDIELHKLIRFSQDYYCYHDHADTIIFSDMRFGQVKGWARKQAPFIFQLYLNKSSGNDLVIQRGRMENITKDAFTSLYERIKGNDSAN